MNAVVDQAVTRLRAAGATVAPVEVAGLDALTRDLARATFEMAEAVDAYLAARGDDVPVRTLAALLARGECHPSLRAHLDAALASPGADSDAYAAQVARSARLRHAIGEVLDTHRLDALILPHQRRLVARIGEEQLERNGVMANATGLPSVCFCGGFSEATADAPVGVPVGIELVGRAHAEHRLLAIAAGYERHARVWRPPPARPV